MCLWNLALTCALSNIFLIIWVRLSTELPVPTLCFCLTRIFLLFMDVNLSETYTSVSM